MLEINLEPSQCEPARARAAELPVYARSHRREAANYVGALGEVVIEQWLVSEAIGFLDVRELKTHDYELLDGASFDVKTKDRTVRPEPHHECSVPAYNHEYQRPSGFVFVSLQRSRDTTGPARFHTAYVLGGQSYRYLQQHGVHWATGAVDPRNGTQFWTACINIEIRELAPPERLAGAWRTRSPSPG